MYDPTIGRWLTPDPIVFEGGNVNLYGFVNNDPDNLDDPTGYSPSSDRFNNFFDQYKRQDELNLPGDILADVSPRIEKLGIVMNKGGGIGDWAISQSSVLTDKAVQLVKDQLKSGALKDCECIPGRAHYEVVVSKEFASPGAANRAPRMT